MTKEFDARNENKSRSVCAAMAEAADTGKRVLSEKERRILDMWPRYEDGAYVWFGDGVRTHNGIAITVEAIEFSLGKVCVKDGEDGDWGTSMYAMHPLKRPAPKVLDADGVEVHVGDTVYELETGEEYKVERVFSGAPDPDFPDHTIRCNKVADPITHVFKPDQLTHTRPDSWERLEEDAVKVVCEYAGAVPDEFGDYDCDTCRLFDARSNLICEQQMALDIVRRAKAIAGVEVDG